VLNTCSTVTHRCTARLVPAPAGFRSSPRAAVRLTRPGRAYATGTVQPNGVVVLQILHRLITPHHYTLTTTYRRVVTHYTVWLG
jgi:hypothetical protein